MSDAGGPGYSPFDVPPGSGGFGRKEPDERPWYRRWSVWILPALVLIGALIAQFAPR